MDEDTEHQKGELLVQGQTARPGKNGIQIALTDPKAPVVFISLKAYKNK